MTSLFSVQLLRWISFCVLLSLVTVYLKGGTSIVKHAKQSPDTNSKNTFTILVTSIFVIGLGILFTMFLFCIEIVRGFRLFQNAAAISIGAVMIVTGVVSTFWFRFKYLGRFWRSNVEVQKDHEIVETGPYRYIRHPLYAMSLFTYTGISIAFAVWWIWIACGATIAGYIAVILYEDDFLTRSLPGYVEYKNRTRYRMIPGVW